MAEEIVITIKAELDVVKKDVKDVKKEVAGIKDSAKKAEGGIKKLAKGFNGVGLAVKAMGIGLLLEAMSILKDVFSQNQVVADAFSTALTAMEIIFNKLVTLVVDNLAEPLKALFEDPLQSVKDLGQAIQDWLIWRFEQLLESVSLFGSALVKLFSGDVTGAMDDATDASLALGNALIGIDLEKTAELATEGFKALTTEIKAATTAAGNLVALRNEVLLAEAKIAQISIKSREEAELQRQIRDDEQVSLEERIAANEELARIIEQSFIDQTALAQKKVDLANAELAVNSSNVELQAALINAETELLAISEEKSGFDSEQLANVNALKKEQDEIAILQAERQNIAEQDALKLIELQIIAKDAELARLTEGTVAYEQALNERAQLDQDKANEEVRLNTETNAKKKADDEKLAAAKNAMVASGFALLKAVAKEGSDTAKAIAVAETIWNTSKAIMAQVAIGGPIGFISAGIAAAMGAVQIANILKTEPDEGASAPQATGASAGAQAAQVPQNASIGDAQQTQINDAIGSNNTIRAYVVGEEVTTQQSLDRQIRATASFT